MERATLRHEQGDVGNAERLALAAFAGSDHTAEGPVFTWLRGQRLQARVALRTRDTSRAMSLLRSAAHVAADTATDGGLAEIADTTALLAEELGRVDVAQRLVALADKRRAGLSVARDPHEEFEIQELRARLRDPAANDPASTEDLLAFLG